MSQEIEKTNKKDVFVKDDKKVTPKNDKVAIYSKYYSGRYLKLLQSTRTNGLAFDNGVAIVTQDELKEVQESEHWNKTIALKRFNEEKQPVKVHIGAQ